jgi:LuxR family maltose regulon positive regulatory protein
LDAGLRGKLTLVSTPAWYDKTTVVSTWVQEAKRPTEWLSLDKNDNDLIRYLTYFIKALQGIEGDIGADVLTTLGVSQASQVEILLTTLNNEIAASGGKLFFILEDYHLIEIP